MAEQRNWFTVAAEGGDRFLAVRLVLLLAAIVSGFILPWPIAFFFAVAWLIVMAWPKPKKS